MLPDGALFTARKEDLLLPSGDDGDARLVRRAGALEIRRDGAKQRLDPVGQLHHAHDPGDSDQRTYERVFDHRAAILIVPEGRQILPHYPTQSSFTLAPRWMPARAITGASL